MPPKLPIWDQRMLKLMEFCISTGKADTQKEFLKSIGMNETGIHQVKKRKTSFRLDHLYAAGKKYSINMNWFFGLEDNMLSNKKKKLPIIMLKEAVIAVELQLKTGH